MQEVIIIGGGNSVREGIDKGLWDKIKGKEIWSLNSVFKLMPYLPSKQLWVDNSFFKHEIGELQKLHKQGVHMISKNYRRLADLDKEITQYGSTRDIKNYHGKQAIEKNEIFYGRMGLCGQFALSLAVAMKFINIFLIGYDFGSKSLEEKKTHWYQDKIKDLNIHSNGAGRPQVYLKPDGKPRRELEDWKVYLRETDVNIWNVSLISHLTYYPRISYEEFFEKLEKLKCQTG